METAPLNWTESRPDLWRSVCGRYAIVRTVLPEDDPNPTAVYTLRKIHPASASAWPGSLGYLVEQAYTLDAAQAAAERDAYAEGHGEQVHVPADHPAVALARFFWPISKGTARAALALVREGERLVARVVGMCRTEDGFEPATYAEIDITGLLDGLDITAVENRTDHDPDPCPDCGAPSGQAHEEGCDVARCLATGGQRLMCAAVGGTPAVVEVDRQLLVGGIRDGHDCGCDVWTGRWPGEAECAEYGWWVQDRCAEGLGWAPCAPGAPGAVPDLNRLHHEATWNPSTMRWERPGADPVGRR